MRFPAIILVALWSLTCQPASANLSPRTPRPRNYDTHSYYALQLSSSSSELSSASTSASAIAHALGVELVEPLGELAGHWIVRTPTTTALLNRRNAGSDPIVSRFKHLRTKRQISPSDARALTPLIPRQRIKRVQPPKRKLPARYPSSVDPFHERDDSELLYAQNTLHLVDPMLNQHRVECHWFVV